MADDGLALNTSTANDFHESPGCALAEDRLMSRGRNPYDPPPDLRGLLFECGLTAAQAERRAGFAPGSLSRVLTGRRGDLRFGTVCRLARAMKVRLGEVAEALERTIEYNEERRRRVRAAEKAFLEADVWQ